jgi:protein-L-isoaspartate O-methyltransferase
MSRTTFDQYGWRAAQISDATVVAGRYSFQRESERLIVGEVARLLHLQPTDRLLEIGFGAGALSVPISYMVDSVTAIDHPAVVARFEEGFAAIKNIQTIGGNFLDLEGLVAHNKILIYGVMQCLADFDEVVHFLRKALGLLAPGGLMLVGDIPNTDRKRRFASSERGKAINASWPANASADLHNFKLDELPPDENLVNLDDAALLKLVQIFRSEGFEVGLLPEAPNLPFGQTREDLLFMRHQ